MRIRKTALALLALMLASAGMQAVSPECREDWRLALDLYRSGMYERARSVFETLAPDPSAEGYVVLCALKMRTDDYGELMTEYDRRYPSTVLTGRIRFENARILLDAGRYGEASPEFSEGPSSPPPAAGSHVDEIIGAADYGQVVLDDEDRGPVLDQGLEHPHQRPHVQGVEADGGFVKDKDRVPLAPAHFTGQLQPLGLSAG